MRNFKKVLAALLACGTLLALSGCGNISETISSAASTVGNEIRASGRDHSKSYTGKDNEVLTNTFFAYNINSAELLSTVEDYLPNDPSHAFLIVDVNVENIFEDDASIPMATIDFELGWEALGDSTTMPEMNFGIAQQLPDEWTQFKGETKTGKLIFIVPNDVTEFNLIYKELYDDDFVGSTYSIAFTPDRSNYVPLTEEEAAMIEA